VRMRHTSADLMIKLDVAMLTIQKPEAMLKVLNKAVSRPAIISSIEEMPKILSRFQIPSRHHDGIMQAHETEPVGKSSEWVNGWGVYNAVTRYNTHTYPKMPAYDPYESQVLMAAAYPLLTL